MTTLTVEAFNEIQNDMNLVPMLIQDDNFPPYQIGDIAGFPPDTAFELWQKFTFKGSGIRVAIPVGADGQPLRLVEPPVTPQAPPTSPVKIPEGWEALHHLQIIRIAGDIAGARPPTVEAAKEIIRAEEMKRNSQ